MRPTRAAILPGRVAQTAISTRLERAVLSSQDEYSPKTEPVAHIQMVNNAFAPNPAFTQFVNKCQILILQTIRMILEVLGNGGNGVVPIIASPAQYLVLGRGRIAGAIP